MRAAIIAVIVVLIIALAAYWVMARPHTKSCTVLPQNRKDASKGIAGYPVWSSSMTNAQNIAAQQAACTGAGYCFQAVPNSAWCYFPA